MKGCASAKVKPDRDQVAATKFRNRPDLQMVLGADGYLRMMTIAQRDRATPSILMKGIECWMKKEGGRGPDYVLYKSARAAAVGVSAPA